MVTTVYQYFDAAGRLLYVGVTARNIQRAKEHAETKTWWPQATGCTLEHFQTRELALEREQQLIESHAPPYNTVHNLFAERARSRYESAPVVERAYVALEDRRVLEAEHDRLVAERQRVFGSAAARGIEVTGRGERRLREIEKLLGALVAKLTRWDACNASSIAQRRAAWFDLDVATRRIVPCVRCGQRPGAGERPECAVCLPAEMP